MATLAVHTQQVKAARRRSAPVFIVAFSSSSAWLLPMLLCITLVPRVWHESGLTARTGVGTLRAMKPLPRKCGWVAVTWGVGYAVNASMLRSGGVCNRTNHFQAWTDSGGRSGGSVSRLWPDV